MAENKDEAVIANAKVKRCVCAECGQVFETTHKRKYCGSCKRKCKHCGAAFIVGKGDNRNKTYCSVECSNRDKLQAKKPKPKCERCGKDVIKRSGRHAGRFCSRECAFAAKATQDYSAKTKANRAERAKQVAERKRKRKLLKYLRYVRVCTECGKPFLGTKQALYCSPTCSRNRAKRYEREKYRRQTIYGDVLKCRWCGAEFALEYKGRRVYCSGQCAKRAEKAAPNRIRRRKNYEQAVAEGETFSSLEIFERDNWMCGIYGEPVCRDESVPHPRAPTLDHIIPLAAGIEGGGVHTRANVQCACFMCNSLKSDTVPLPRGDTILANVNAR